MRVSEQEGLTVCKQSTYAGQITCVQVNDSQIAQAGLREDNAGDNENATRDKRTYSIGENMLEHDP